jgi:hypothetical protein
METYGGVLTSALDEGEWSVWRSGHFTPKEIAPGGRLIGTVGLRAAYIHKTLFVFLFGVVYIVKTLTSINFQNGLCRRIVRNVIRLADMPGQLSRYSDGLDGRCSILSKGKGFLCTPQRLDRLWGHSNSLSNVYRGPSPGVKRQGREGDYSPPSSAEVKNGGAIPALTYTSSRRCV